MAAAAAEAAAAGSRLNLSPTSERLGRTEQQLASMADEASMPFRSPNSRVTWEGCSVLLDINDGDRIVFARLSPSAVVKIGDKKCSLRPLVGCPFGSLFQVEASPKGPHLVHVATPSAPSEVATGEICLQEEDGEQFKGDFKDNRSLLDDNKAQSLTGDDIDAMRRDGASGDEIIEALIANSSTFEKKTVFSQAKYRLRKQKKYAPRVLLRRPFMRSICEAYFKKYPTRIGFLRVDTLSLLLSMANVSAYSDVLVVDMVGGIVVGAVAERLGGTGYVCSTYIGAASHPMDIVRMFNFSSEICSRIVQAPLSSICLTQCADNDTSASHEVSSSLVSQHNGSGDSNVNRSVLDNDPLKEQNGKLISTGEHDSLDPENIYKESPSTVNKSVSPGREASLEVINLWKQRGFSSLIIAAPDLDAWKMVKDLLPLLSYSAPFAIYHQYLQPLATCMHRLQTEKMAISLQISECWLREYQVLPSRTHPHMQMSGTGGYVLSGIRVMTES